MKTSSSSILLMNNDAPNNHVDNCSDFQIAINIKLPTPTGLLNKWEKQEIFHQVQSWKMSNLRTWNKEKRLRARSGGLRKMDELIIRYDIFDACLQDHGSSNRKVKHWNGRRRASSDMLLTATLYHVVAVALEVAGDAVLLIAIEQFNLHVCFI